MDPQTFLYALDECTRENTDYSNLVEYTKKIKRADVRVENPLVVCQVSWSFSAKQNVPLIWSNLNCAELIYGGYLCPSREKSFEVSLFVPRFCSFLVQMPLCILLEEESCRSFFELFFCATLTYANMLFKVGLLR